MKKNIGNIISRTRRSKKMTQQTLSDKVGISKPTLIKIEADIGNHSATTLQKIFQVLDIKVTVEAPLISEDDNN